MHIQNLTRKGALTLYPFCALLDRKMLSVLIGHRRLGPPDNGKLPSACTVVERTGRQVDRTQGSTALLHSLFNF